MTISILFSVAIYQISVTEVGSRLERLQGFIQNRALEYERPPIDSLSFRTAEQAEASSHLIQRLVLINIAVLAIGLGGGYFLARRTLRPVEEAHDTQVRFVSDTSHELRTPLAVMKSEIEVTLRDKNTTNAELKETLRSNLEEVNNLAKLAETLLAIARGDHEKLQKAPIYLDNVVRAAAGRFKQPDTRLHINHSTKTKVFAHEASLVELVCILIDNALRYSPSDSTVHIAVFEKSGKAHIQVSNEGEGIDEQAMDHIFDRFYRGDLSRSSSNEKGFGLGLALAKQISDLHGGEITATSAPKQTTTFTYSQTTLSK